MGAIPVLAQLPEVYSLERGDTGILAVHREWAEPLAAVGFGLASDGELRPSEHSGRRPLQELHTTGGRLLVRRYHHGGLLRWLTTDRYTDPSRPFAELVAADHLERHGVATPPLIAARAQRSGRRTWRLVTVSLLLDDTMDGGEVLERVRAEEVAPEPRARIFFAAGELVGRATRAGLRHADLGPRNLLFGADALIGATPRAFVLDLDGARLVASLADDARRANLGRLYRGVVRRERRGRAFLTSVDRERFLAGFADGAGQPTEDVAIAWGGVVRSYRRRRLWHALGRGAERVFGGGPEARDGRAWIRP
jgi:hypothetical protein